MEPLCGRTALLVQVAWLLLVSVCSSPVTWQRANASGGHFDGMSPEDYGLRPANPLDELPPPDLIESPNKKLDPSPLDLNVTALKAMLGRNFDAQFMSITRPRPSSRNQNGSIGSDLIEFPFRRNKFGRLVPVGDMPRFLRKMNFRHIKLPDDTRLRTHISAKLQKKLQHFLWAYTACPVVYRWKDLGIRFWPRYLKEGYCPAGKTSCSIPPGMTCRPAAKTHKAILRWYCPHHHHNSGSTSANHHRNLLYSSSSVTMSATLYPTTADTSMLSLASSGPTHKQPCKWIRVEYPIVKQCSCSCPSNS